MQETITTQVPLCCTKDVCVVAMATRQWVKVGDLINYYHILQELSLHSYDDPQEANGQRIGKTYYMGRCCDY